VKALVSFLRTEIESCTLHDVNGVARVYASAWKATADRARHLAILMRRSSPAESSTATGTR
jgi:hypothetical protein